MPPFEIVIFTNLVNSRTISGVLDDIRNQVIMHKYGISPKTFSLTMYPIVVYPHLPK